MGIPPDGSKGGHAGNGQQLSAASRALRQNPVFMERLIKVVDTYTQKQRVVYLDSGEAFNVALDFLGTPEVDDFVAKCMAGVVSIFLEQRGSSVRATLINNFDTVLVGACKIILFEIKVQRNLRDLETLNSLLNDENTFYATPDNIDSHHHTALNHKTLLANSFGWNTRKKVIETFEHGDGFAFLLAVLKGGRELIPSNGMEGDLDEQPTGEPLSAETIRLLLEPFVHARDIIGPPRVSEACYTAMAAVEGMGEDVLKLQRGAELTKLHKLLRTVLNNDEKLKVFLLNLSLKTFDSKAFQLRKLGLDLMCKLISDTQGRSSNRLGQSFNQMNEDFDLAASEADMLEWLVKNEVLEKLFSSPDSVHPALVGRSKNLLEFMAHGDVLSRQHINLMFKICVGHHDSVRGAVQALLAEIAVDGKVRPALAAYILRYAIQFVEEHRNDMFFLVEKLMGFVLDSGGIRPLYLASSDVLLALLDLLWRLLETGTDLNSSKRTQLVDYLVEIFRFPNAQVLRARYIVSLIQILQDSCASTNMADMSSPSFLSQPPPSPNTSFEAVSNSGEVRLFNAYETLQKILSLFRPGSSVRAASMQTNLAGTRRSSAVGLSYGSSGSSSDPFDFCDSEFRKPDVELSPDQTDIEVDSDQMSLVISTVNSNDRIVRTLRPQGDVIVSLEERYKLLELVVEETKAHSHLQSQVKKNSKEQIVQSMQTLQCRLDFLHFCVSRSNLMLNFDLVHYLWEALQNPIEREMLMVWLRQIAVVESGSSAGLTEQVTRRIFSELLCEDMDFKHMSEAGFNCFSALFLDVNRTEDILVGEVLACAQGSNANTTILSALQTEVTAGSQNVGLGSTVAKEADGRPKLKKQKKTKKKKSRTSIFTDFLPSFRSSWGSKSKKSASGSARVEASSGSFSPDVSINSSPSSTGQATKNSLGSGGVVGGARVVTVKRPDVVGIDTLWKIVQDAPSAAAARAMDLLLQVQCRIESLEERRHGPGNDFDTDEVTGGLEEAEVRLSGVQRRVQFLDRTFDFLEESVHSTETKNNDKVQRSIRLITYYLQSFPQSAFIASHAPPRGNEVELTVHHDKVLVFSSADVGKLLNFAIPNRRPGTGRAQQIRYFPAIVVKYDEVDRKHTIWFFDGREITRDMTEMQRSTITTKSTENTYQMQPRSQFPNDKIPFQTADLPLEVEKAWSSYEPITIRVRDKSTLGALQRMILDHLVDDQYFSALNRHNISLTAHIYHKSQQHQQGSMYTVNTGDSGHERLLIGKQNSLQEVLPDPSEAAGVEKTATTQVVLHTINVDLDDQFEFDLPVADVDDESELPSVLISAENSKYAGILMELLDDPKITDSTRVELWNLVQTLPTDQSLLSRFEKDYETISWEDELLPAGRRSMLVPLYKLMIVNRLLGNESRPATFSGGLTPEALSESESFNANRQSVWRSSFFGTGGFQDVIRLLSIIVASNPSDSSPDDWFLNWQRSVALPIVLQIIRFCVSGALSISQNSSNISPGDKSQFQFSPSSKSIISEKTDLQVLAGNLSRLIVIAHRATCSQSGGLLEDFSDDDSDDDGVKAAVDVSESQGEQEDNGSDSEATFDSSEDSDSSSGGEIPAMHFDENELQAIAEERDDSKLVDEKDESMLEVLINGIQTAFLLIEANERFGSDLLNVQVFTRFETATNTTSVGSQSRVHGANSIVDVLLLSRFPVIRQMLQRLLENLCEISEDNCEIISHLSRETLMSIPRNCTTCDDFINFMRGQIVDGKFHPENFTRVVMERLVKYPGHSRHYLRREANLLASFSVQLRNQCFKPRPGVSSRPPNVQDNQQYRLAKRIILSLLDNTIIGYMDLMELLLREDSVFTSNFEVCEPLMQCLFDRYLMAVSGTSKKINAIASLPDTRTRAFNLLKVLASGHPQNLRYLVARVRDFVQTTPTPVRAGKIDWAFKPTDIRKSPTGFVGLVNQGATCYQNSVLQQVFMSPQLREWVRSAVGLLPSLLPSTRAHHRTNHPDYDEEDEIDDDEEEEDDDDVDDGALPNMYGPQENRRNRLLRSLQYTFAFLKDSDKRYFNPRDFVNESACLKLMDGHLSQNDAIEFYSRLIDYLEGVTGDCSQSRTLQEMLYVRTCTMNVRNCEGKHRTESEIGTPFLTLNIRSGMAGPTLHSLDDALESWFKSEKLSGLECEHCNQNDKEKRFDADQIKCFSKLPPILVVQIQRFDFDYETMQPTKLNHRVSFDQKIDLYRFTKDAVMKKFEENQKPSSKDTEDDDPSTQEETGEDDDGMNVHGASGDCEGDGCCSRNPGVQNTTYELCGVVVHQGSGANFGHYYSFIKDRKSGAWFRFDDERVTPFDVRNLEEECFGGSSVGDGSNQWNPYSMGGKMKSFGAKDNNAYLLLYELVQSTEESETIILKKQSPSQREAGAETPFIGEEISAQLFRFPQLAKVATMLKRRLRQARLSLMASDRMRKVEKEVLEDNQRTQRHSLVMVPNFMEFVLSLLSSVPHHLDETLQSEIDSELYGSVAQMGITVLTKATLRMATQKPRLLEWERILTQMLFVCSKLQPDVICWFLDEMMQKNTRQDTLEPLLLSCSDKTSPKVFLSLVIKAISCAAASSISNRSVEAERCQRKLDEFVELMIGLLPKGVVNCRFMTPFFSVWRTLSKIPDLRDVLISRRVAESMIQLYCETDPDGLRSRRVTMDSVAQNNLAALNAAADFSPLVDAVSILTLGCTAESVHKSLVRSGPYSTADDIKDCEEDGFSEFGANHVTPGQSQNLKPLRTEPCSIPEEEENRMAEIKSYVLSMFDGLKKEISSLRYAGGLPLEEAESSFYLPSFILSLAKRDPGSGAQILAQSCKGDSNLTRNVYLTLVNSIEKMVAMQSVANLSVDQIRLAIKQHCKALFALMSIEDGLSHDRNHDIVSEMLRLLLQLEKEFKQYRSRRDYQRNPRMNLAMYSDGEVDESYELLVYSMYALTKTLMQTYKIRSHVRFWLRELNPYWIKLLPNLMELHSYERCMGGNSDVFTRSVSKGKLVRLTAQVAASLVPEVKINFMEPMRVSVDVQNSGMPDCNGLFAFDGYFNEGESLQIDTVTPKFVHIANGRPINLYRCLIKDKQYTWYISELSAKPGTNNDTDYYNSPRDNPSNMPPEGGWTSCGKGIKPSPQVVRIIRERFIPEDDPCQYVRSRRQPFTSSVGNPNGTVTVPTSSSRTAPTNNASPPASASAVPSEALQASVQPPAVAVRPDQGNLENPPISEGGMMFSSEFSDQTDSSQRDTMYSQVGSQMYSGDENDDSEFDEEDDGDADSVRANEELDDDDGYRDTDEGFDN